ncbi:unnamed protein product, partial [Linum tenue]
SSIVQLTQRRKGNSLNFEESEIAIRPIPFIGQDCYGKGFDLSFNDDNRRLPSHCLSISIFVNPSVPLTLHLSKPIRCPFPKPFNFVGANTFPFFYIASKLAATPIFMISFFNGHSSLSTILPGALDGSHKDSS